MRQGTRVEQATKYGLTLNLKTAQADRVIE